MAERKKKVHLPKGVFFVTHAVFGFDKMAIIKSIFMWYNTWQYQIMCFRLCYNQFLSIQRLQLTNSDKFNKELQQKQKTPLKLLIRCKKTLKRLLHAALTELINI